MQNLEVSEGNKMISFEKLIVRKCQSIIELKQKHTLDSCQDQVIFNNMHTNFSCIYFQLSFYSFQEKKKELQLDYKENKMRLRNRSIGNCW